MTEGEWLNCTNCQQMLAFLQGHASDRKLRLFAVACCHRIQDLRTDEMGEQAVLIAERIAEGGSPGLDLVDFTYYLQYQAFQYIDGFKKERHLNIAYCATSAAYHSLPDVLPPDAVGGFETLRPHIEHVPLNAAWAVAHSRRRGDKDEAEEAVFRQEAKQQAELLRDIFGPLPFCSVAVDPAWTAWNDNAVTKLAQSIYDNRAFQLVAILADALEDAGCTDFEILEHCRGPGPHVRGCWVVDLLLAKG